jgi:hypothetical protein
MKPEERSRVDEQEEREMGRSGGVEFIDFLRCYLMYYQATTCRDS